MIKTLKVLSLGLVITLLTACGEPTLDTSSDQAMKTSIQEIMAELPSDEQKRFKETIAGIYMLAIMPYFGNDALADQAKARLDEELDGKNAEEIFTIAKKIGENSKNKG